MNCSGALSGLFYSCAYNLLVSECESLGPLQDSASLLRTLLSHVASYLDADYKKFEGFAMSRAETLFTSTSITYSTAV